jgi:hypothetical protein
MLNTVFNVFRNELAANSWLRGVWNENTKYALFPEPERRGLIVARDGAINSAPDRPSHDCDAVHNGTIFRSENKQKRRNSHRGVPDGESCYTQQIASFGLGRKEEGKWGVDSGRHRIAVGLRRYFHINHVARVIRRKVSALLCDVSCFEYSS